MDSHFLRKLNGHSFLRNMYCTINLMEDLYEGEGNGHPGQQGKGQSSLFFIFCFFSSVDACLFSEGFSSDMYLTVSIFIKISNKSVVHLGLLLSSFIYIHVE